MHDHCHPRLVRLHLFMHYSSSDEERVVYVNLVNICTISADKQGGSYVTLADGRGVHVAESPKNIYDLINGRF